jgi:hypothetical protein
MQADWRQKWGLHTLDSLRVRVRELGASEYLIKGLIPTRSIGFVFGDSGLGKSPLLYQAGICVAAGVPFLGCETRQGRVLIADFENGIADMHELADRISRYAGASASSDQLALWSLNDCHQRFGQPGYTLLDMLREVRPTLAIIDSLGSYAPAAEEKNSSATLMLQEFRSLARECGTATLFVHHRRKQARNGEQSAGSLEDAILRQWFQDARGASALVNNSDIRFGVDEPDISSIAKDEVALVLRGFGRVRGEIGPLFLARDRDENGDAAGYRRLTGANLLFNPQQESTLAALPQLFTFKEARLAYGKGDQSTANFLQRCIDLDLLRKPGRGRYVKVSPQNGKSDGAPGEAS